MYGPFDKNVPNAERIVLVPNDVVELARYVIVLGLANPMGTVSLFYDQLYSFPEQIVTPDTWVYVFTGPGKTKSTSVSIADGKQPALVLHWGRPTTLFTSDIVVPVLLELNGILIGDIHLQKPKTPLLQSGLG
jgi:hypothetical protein